MTSKPHSELVSTIRHALVYTRYDGTEECAICGYALDDHAGDCDYKGAVPALESLVEQLEAQDRLLMRAAELLHNSTPPRDAGWHDRFDLWLADNRSHPASSPASVRHSAGNADVPNQDTRGES